MVAKKPPRLNEGSPPFCSAVNLRGEIADLRKPSLLQGSFAVNRVHPQTAVMRPEGQS